MKQINDFKATDDNSLPQNTFYLGENHILCCERKYGVSRFAYDANGLVVWARSSGHIDAYDSTFTIFRELNNFEDASIAFMGGLLIQTASFMPTNNASIDLVVKGQPITVKYQNTNSGSRTFKLNGKQMTANFDDFMNTHKLFIPTAEITSGMVIEVID